MFFVGDIHGNLDRYRKYLKILRRKFPQESVIQVGDMGVGFPYSQSDSFPKHSWFIRGNHDNPEIALQNSQYLGNFGVKEIDGYKIFFVSGAWSIDRIHRTQGKDWWPEEELTVQQLNEALDLYIMEKPEIVISHDGPQQPTYKLLNRILYDNGSYIIRSPIPTRTGQALTAMFENHKPKLWLFGHYHTKWEMTIDSTKFICLPEPIDENDFLRLEDIQF